MRSSQLKHWRTNKKMYVAFIRLINTLGALGHCAIWKYIYQNWMEGVFTDIDYQSSTKWSIIGSECQHSINGHQMTRIRVGLNTRSGRFSGSCERAHTRLILGVPIAARLPLRISTTLFSLLIDNAQEGEENHAKMEMFIIFFKN